MLFSNVARNRPNEPLRYGQFLCLRMTEKLVRGARASELKTYAEEAAEAFSDGITIARMS